MTTFIALLVRDLATDGLQIEGAGTWVLATLLIPVFLVKAGVESARDNRNR